MGPDVRGRHLFRNPCPWLCRLKGLRFTGGDQGKGCGVRAQGGSGWGDRVGKEAHWILQSDRSPWKCRAAGALPGEALKRGSAGPHLWPIPTFRHFREKLMTASVLGASPWLPVSSAAPTPSACPEAAGGQRRAAGRGTPLAGSMSECWVLLQLFTL